MNDGYNRSSSGYQPLAQCGRQRAARVQQAWWGLAQPAIQRCATCGRPWLLLHMVEIEPDYGHSHLLPKNIGGDGESRWLVVGEAPRVVHEAEGTFAARARSRASHFLSWFIRYLKLF